jgi:ELWxxDGT repeat protein
MSGTLAPARRRFAALPMLLAGALVFAPAPAHAASPVQLAKAINRSTADAAPSGVVDLHGVGYFLARGHGTHDDLIDPSQQLMRTDGTAAGTSVVADLAAQGWRQAKNLVVAGDALYFTAVDAGSAGETLWKSDGTAAGTSPIWRAGASSLGFAPLASDGHQLVFSTFDAQRRGAVYRLASGTSTPELIASTDDSVQQTAITADGAVFYTTYSDTGYELWKTTGSPATAQRLRQRSGLDGPWDLEAVGNRVYFSATATPSDPLALWTSDGTVSGTVAVSLPSGDEPHWPYGTVAVGNSLYLTGSGDESTPHASQDLFRVDGATMTRVTDGSAGLEHPEPGAAFGGRLYFTAGAPGHRQLWRTEASGATDQVTTSADVTAAYAARGTLWFVNDDKELWSSDGSTGPQHFVTTLPAGLDPGNFGVVAFDAAGSNVYFAVRTAAAGLELWRSDGTAAGTGLVKDVNADPLDARVQAGARLGDAVYFGATDGSAPGQLWKSDGTEPGTALVTTLSTQIGLRSVVSTGSALAIDAYDGTLWWSDGTASGTHEVRPAGWPTDRRFGPDASPTRIGNRMVFVAPDADGVPSLWISDGSADGTRTLKVLGTANDDAFQAPRIVSAGGTAYFNATDPQHGNELWRTDGTAAGTILVRDFVPGPANGGMIAAASSATQLAFTAPDAGGTPRLWTTSGTSETTEQVAPDALGWVRSVAIASPGTVYLSQVDPNTSEGSLMRSDGRGQPLRSVLRSPLSWPLDLVPYGRGVLYAENTLSDGTHPAQGAALWRTDGAQATLLHRFAGGELAQPQLTVTGRTAFLQGHEPATGMELWRTDGSAASTELVADLLPGAESGQPTALMVATNRLVFSATDPSVGRQLFSVGYDATATAPDPLPTSDGTPPGPDGPTGPGGTTKVTPKQLTAKATRTHDTRRPYRYAIRGNLTLPAGTSVAEACHGTVVVTVKRGKRVVVKRDGPLKIVKGVCTYSVSFGVPTKHLARRGKLTASVSFLGSARLLPLRAKTLTLRYGR